MLIFALASAGGTAGYGCASGCHNCPCGKEVALGETASGADTGRTIGVPARSRFAVSLVVPVTGARNGDPVPTTSYWKRREARRWSTPTCYATRRRSVTSAADPCSVMTPRAVSWVGRLGRLRALVVPSGARRQEESCSAPGDARCSGHHRPPLEPLGDLRARLEVARLDLVAMFHALDRMDLFQRKSRRTSCGNSWKRMPTAEHST